MNVSCIIPSLYEVDGDYLELCVTSLRQSGFDGQIIVVTNGTQAIPKLPFKGVSKHLHTSQQGQCNAVNVGAQMASGEYLLISNSDMYYSPDWSKNLAFDYTVFSPNLVEPTNNPGSAEPFLKFDGGFTLEEFRKDFVDGFIKRNIDTKEPDEAGFNLPFFIRKDLFDFLGGFDIVYDPWGSNSDTDFQTRINLAGIIPMRLRNVLVYHFSNKSGTFDGTHIPEYQHNLEYFKEKFGFDRDELNSDVWYNKDMIPTDKERIKYEQTRFSQS